MTNGRHGTGNGISTGAWAWRQELKWEKTRMGTGMEGRGRKYLQRERCKTGRAGWIQCTRFPFHPWRSRCKAFIPSDFMDERGGEQRISLLATYVTQIYRSHLLSIYKSHLPVIWKLLYL
jgi:hypothetical protein